MRKDEARILKDRIEYIMPFIKETHVKEELEDMIFQINYLMKKENENNLKKALFVLLLDQFDCLGIEEWDNDNETYIEYIVDALIEKNENICPYKNYDCVEYCPNKLKKCVDGVNINCNKEIEEIWKHFIEIG